MSRSRIAFWIPFGDLMHDERSASEPIFRRGPGSPEWWERRASVFAEYTARSLVAQSKRDFVAILGIAEETRDIAGPVLDVAKRFGPRMVPHYHPARATLDRGQSPVKAAIEQVLTDNESAVFVHLDSDDMYAKDAAELLSRQPTDEGMVYLFTQGYILDSASGSVSIYHPKGCPPPFFGRTYVRSALRDLDGFEKRWNLLTFHPQLPASVKRTEMPKGRFCVCVHGGNTSTGFGNSHTSSNVGDLLSDKVAMSVLKEFGREPS